MPIEIGRLIGEMTAWSEVTIRPRRAWPRVRHCDGTLPGKGRGLRLDNRQSIAVVVPGCLGAEAVFSLHLGSLRYVRAVGIPAGSTRWAAEGDRSELRGIIQPRAR